MITAHHLSKHFGATRAVEDVSFEVQPGRVTGFLGPNGSGKTTTLRVLPGLAAPTAGSATIGGVPYRRLREPARSVGAVLDSMGFSPTRTAAEHLRLLASAAGFAKRRVDEVLGVAGIAEAAHRRVGGFSLGMRQRLSLAAALLGDPQVLVLDEPLNGLDPDGIRWMRCALRQFASEGRTVLLATHLLAEVAHTVDDVLVIADARGPGAFKRAGRRDPRLGNGLLRSHQLSNIGQRVMTTALRLMRAELRKTFRSRAFLGAVGISIGLTLLSVVADAAVAGKQGRPALGTTDNVHQMLKFGAVTTVASLVLGILASGGEYRQRTIVSTVLVVRLPVGLATTLTNVVKSGASALTPVTAVAVLGLYAIVLVGAAAVVTARRDLA
jgi:ABC-type Na+ transport system ATPase subunit NatA